MFFLFVFWLEIWLLNRYRPVRPESPANAPGAMLVICWLLRIRVASPEPGLVSLQERRRRPSGANGHDDFSKVVYEIPRVNFNPAVCRSILEVQRDI